MTQTGAPLPEPVTPTTHDWPAQAADSIVEVVGKARQKTTGPAITASRGVVFGLLVLILATMALLLVVIGSLRLLNNWLDVWLSYLVLGTIFVIVGLLLWQKSKARAEIELGTDGNQSDQT